MSTTHCEETGRKRWKCHCPACTAVRLGAKAMGLEVDPKSVSLAHRELNKQERTWFSQLEKRFFGLSKALLDCGVVAQRASAMTRGLMVKLVLDKYGRTLEGDFRVTENGTFIDAWMGLQRFRFPVSTVAEAIIECYRQDGLRPAEPGMLFQATPVKDPTMLWTAIMLYRQVRQVTNTRSFKLLAVDHSDQMVLITPAGRFVVFSAMEIHEKMQSSKPDDLMQQVLENMARANARGRVSDPGDSVFIEEHLNGPGEPVERIVYIGSRHTHLRIGDVSIVLHREGPQVWAEAPAGRIRLA